MVGPNREIEVEESEWSKYLEGSSNRRTAAQNLHKVVDYVEVLEDNPKSEEDPPDLLKIYGVDLDDIRALFLEYLQTNGSKKSPTLIALRHTYPKNFSNARRAAIDALWLEVSTEKEPDEDVSGNNE